jgi:hypothetical protein
MAVSMLKKDISARSGFFAAILITALFASAQVACLSHAHCDGTECFEDGGVSGFSHLHGHHQETGSSCGKDHQDHDIHHHSRDVQTHPKRRFIVPAADSAPISAGGAAVPAFCLESRAQTPDDAPLPERYRLAFEGRAPPLS